MQQMVDSVDLMKNGCLIIQDSNGDTMLTFSNNEALLKKRMLLCFPRWIIPNGDIPAPYFRACPSRCSVPPHRHRI